MGNVGSRLDDGSALVVKDHNRLSVTGVKITTARNRTLYNIVPHGYPPTRYTIQKESEDEVAEFVQDPDNTSATPNFLLRLTNDEEFFFYFTFTMRQGATPMSPQIPDNPPGSPQPSLDTIINSLTFMLGSTPKDLETLMTREFNADPNIHRNANVELVGDYTTGGSFVEQFEWAWKWRPPKVERDRGGGWRNACSFVEYDSRSHRLIPLVAFSFWVQSGLPQVEAVASAKVLDTKRLGTPKSPPPRLEFSAPRLRIASAQSIESRLSDSDTEATYFREPPSPIAAIPEFVPSLEPVESANTIKVDLSYQRPGEDVSAVEDGPLFRATMKALEQKTGNMRMRIKKVLKRAEAAREAQISCNSTVMQFMEALREASTSNANAVQPALDHYFEKIATEILLYEKQNAANMQRIIIEPISKLYQNEIKQAEAKKKDFDEESRDYYTYVSRYLGQRQDSLKEKKRLESDSKYESKRRNFELRRFDYSSFMQDLHGGRKDQEVLSMLTKYAETQARGYLATAKKIEAMAPQLDALCFEVGEADKEYQLLRTGREEKRRVLEKGGKQTLEADSLTTGFGPVTPTLNNLDRRMAAAEAEFGQLNGLTPPSTRERPRSVGPVPVNGAAPNSAPDLGLSASPRGGTLISASLSQNRFKGIRDLEERDRTLDTPGSSNTQYRKEGLLWSIARPGSLSDPKALKPGWHKFWIVLDQGKLSEYVNWKAGLEPHMDPIDLRVASVREARHAERRFCFEIITPHFIRVYQATSEDDMKAWILAINNALQTAFEGKAPPLDIVPGGGGKSARDLFGKSSSLHSHRSLSSSHNAASKAPARYATVADRPMLTRSLSSSERVARLLTSIRDADAGNSVCADCSSDARVEWVSINLGVVVCIECSGIHRSLGTHISKIRSLTLDTVSFTQDIVELLLQIGNRVSNMAWEARLNSSTTAGPNFKPPPTATREQRLRFITAKYVDRAFVQPPAAAPGHAPPHADDLLLTGIKRNDIRAVTYALALHANPNATDRSRATHAVYLALAAADPAAPSPGISPSPSAANIHTPNPGSRKSFPIAELLLQNGSDVPSLPPPIPLSSSAKAYLEFKRDQKLGIVRGKPSSDMLVSSAPAGGAEAGFVPGQHPQVLTPGFNAVGVGPAGQGLGIGGGVAQGFAGGAGLERREKRVSAGRQLLKGVGVGGGG